VISAARARAHWHLRSGLARPLSGSPDEVIARTGWLRTLGGVDVYLAARARVPGLGRAALEALVESGRLRVIPAVRGCIYLVPSVHVPLALRVASEAWRKTTERELAKAGSSWNEIEDVGRAVANALGSGAMRTDAIRKAVTVRSFGEAGKKLGLSSPLPVALRDLELRGRIERTLDGGRLDTERYLWRIAPLTLGAVPDDARERHAELARIYAEHAGPWTVQDFASWSGLSVRDARAAVERAALARVAVESYAEEAWMLPEHVDAIARDAEPTSAVSLLSFEDNYLVAHGGPKWCVDPAHWSTPVLPWGTQQGGTLGTVTHLLSRTLTIGDELAGLWEMDPDAGQVLWATFAPAPRAAREALDRLAVETTALLAEIGHAHSFSLDTDADVRERAGQVARLASGEREPVKRKPAAKKKAKPPAVTQKPAPKQKPTKPAAKQKPAPKQKAKPAPKPKRAASKPKKAPAKKKQKPAKRKR
jgi:hypothetical protein